MQKRDQQVLHSDARRHTHDDHWQIAQYGMVIPPGTSSYSRDL